MEELLSTMFLALLHVRRTWKLNIVAFDLDTQRILNFNLTHNPDSGEDFHFVDIARLLSEVNRRTYRQGMTYDVLNMVFHDSDTSETQIRVCTAPNTWPLQLAWKTGFDEWMLQQRAALRTTGLDDFGPWHDFKVYLNAVHKAHQSASPQVDNAIFIDMEGNTLSTTGSATTPPGEWVHSTYEIAQHGSSDPVETHVCLMGPNTGTYPNYSLVSLLEELETVLNVPTADPELPSTASESLWALISAEQPDVEVLREVVASIEDDNDLPPYSPDIIPGAGAAGTGRPSDPWLIRQCCIPGGGAHMAAVGGFTAPCGLICIETDQESEANIVGVQLELAPGDYKGVSARPMRGGGR